MEPAILIHHAVFTIVRVCMYECLYACYSLLTGYRFCGAGDPDVSHSEHNHQYLLRPLRLLTASRPHTRQGNQGLLP